MEKEAYMEPRVLATYSKEELEQTIKPHGSLNGYCDPGCGCGCGCGGCGCGCGPNHR